MNIKIKASGVSCLFSEDYDRVYAALQKKLSQEHAALFSERIPGYEYLQWVLPGEDWVALPSCDPILKGELYIRLDCLKQGVRVSFGANQQMAQRVLTVPDDSYVYFRKNINGQLDIRLTAWGYRYPERVRGGGGSGQVDPQKHTAHISIMAYYNGEPHTNYALKLNGYHRLTNEHGMIDIGDLPIGYRFTLETEQGIQQIEVAGEDRIIELDTTRYTQVEVEVLTDEKACSGEKVRIIYGGHDLQLTTDASGKVNTQLPISLHDEFCTVEVRELSQQKILDNQANRYIFKLVNPIIADSPEPADVPIKVENPMEAPEQAPTESDLPIEESTLDSSVIESPEEPPAEVPVVQSEPSSTVNPVQKDPESDGQLPSWLIYFLEGLALLVLLTLLFVCYYVGGSAFFT